MTYYELLQVREDASQEVIEASYRALSEKYGPDLYTGSPDEATHIMAEINEAYKTLSNPKDRVTYDLMLLLQSNDTKKSYDDFLEDLPDISCLREPKTRLVQTQRNSPLKIAIIIIGLFICGLLLGYAKLEADSLKKPLENILVSDKETANDSISFYDRAVLTQIETNFNMLAELCGYSNYKDLLNYLSYDFDSTSADSLKEAYEYIVVEAYGVMPYEYLEGTVDPYTNETIEDFLDYQEYVYNFLTN